MTVEIIEGDAFAELQRMPERSVHCCVTSPPYFGLRDYGVAGQIGLESTVEEYVAALVGVFREVRRVLRDDGTLWLNLGDSYNAHPGQRKTTDKIGPKQETNIGSNTTPSRYVEGLKPKDLIGIPWLVAFALRADGWYLRQDIIWAKPNPMPESMRDRCTKAHEYIFILAKSGRPTIWKAEDTGEWSNTPDLTQRLPAPTEDDPAATIKRWRGYNYYFDADAIAEDAVADHPSGNGYKRSARKSYQNGDGTARGNDKQWTGVGGKRNRRSIWTVTTKPFKEAHFATFPPDLIEPCILAGCPEGGTVLDPFGGAGTTGLVAARHRRNAVLIELNPAYAEMAERRIVADHEKRARTHAPATSCGTDAYAVDGNPVTSAP